MLEEEIDFSLTLAELHDIRQAFEFVNTERALTPAEERVYNRITTGIAWILEEEA